MSIDGLLVVDKPSGPTSHDIVSQARRLYGTRSVGHAGTLDPMASGVLVLLFGEATKLSPYLTAEQKEYRATLSFGRSTDTLDALGRTTAEEPLTPGWLTDTHLARALDIERARLEQEPPAFSALSVNGTRAYRKARRGEAVALASRPVGVRALRALSYSDTELVVELRVSKGYYVRAFARDVGTSLRVPAHLSALVRLASGPYRLEDAVKWPPADRPPPIPLAAAAGRALPTARLTEEGAVRARQGKALHREDFASAPGDEDDVACWVDPDGRLAALGRLEPSGEYRVVRGFRAAVDNSSR